MLHIFIHKYSKLNTWISLLGCWSITAEKEGIGRLLDTLDLVSHEKYLGQWLTQINLNICNLSLFDNAL
jgi:hypothetical protein